MLGISDLLMSGMATTLLPLALVLTLFCGPAHLNVLGLFFRLTFLVILMKAFAFSIVYTLLSPLCRRRRLSSLLLR